MAIKRAPTSNVYASQGCRRLTEDFFGGQQCRPGVSVLNETLRLVGAHEMRLGTLPEADFIKLWVFLLGFGQTFALVPPDVKACLRFDEKTQKPVVYSKLAVQQRISTDALSEGV